MANYKGHLKDGRPIYVPEWDIPTQLENLTKAGKYLGAERAITISEINVPAVITAIMESDQPKILSNLIAWFVCQARLDGSKIEPETINDMFAGELHVVAEIFAHVMHAQYYEFFRSGLAKEHSQ